MNRNEARVAAKLLDLASDIFSCHSCNDYYLPLTPENIALVRDMESKSGNLDYEPIILENPITFEKDCIYTGDFLLMTYLSERLAAFADEED